METNILSDGVVTEDIPESVGIWSGDIANYIKRLREVKYDLHSLQIVKDGKLVFAHAAQPYTLESPHRLLSAAKAIIAAAVLFAIDEGALSFESKIIDYFRDKLPKDYDKRFEDITVYDLLTMQTGQNSDKAFMYFLEHPDADLCKLFFETPMDCKPGVRFFYNNSIPHLLFFLVERATKTGIETYINEKLCIPLGIEIVAQHNKYDIFDPVTIVISANGFLKLGLWFLQNGRWKEKQLINPELIKRACMQQTWTGSETSGYQNGKGYCMQLWKNAFGGCRMHGGGGQIALMLPEQNMVVAIMANESREDLAIQLFYEEILSKMMGRKLIQEPEGKQLIETASQNMSRIYYDLVPIDKSNSQMNGKTYEFNENSWKIQSVNLLFTDKFATIQMKQDGVKKEYKVGMEYTWFENTSLFIVNPDLSIQNCIYGSDPQICKLSGGWINDSTFIIVCKSAASMGYYTFQIEFSEEHLKLSIPGGVSAGMKQESEYISLNSL